MKPRITGAAQIFVWTPTFQSNSTEPRQKKGTPTNTGAAQIVVSQQRLRANAANAQREKVNEKNINVDYIDK